jgi:DNA-binding SARP family transcriptional activator
VLAFIALHGTVTAERIENAVWAAPSSSSRRKRLANTVSEIRAAIGRQHLPAAADGRYTTGPAVTTDAHLFDHLVRRAAGESPDSACVTLRAALDVVTGPVFTYREVDRASFTWVDLENLVSTWELRIAAVAERCADLYIEMGQPSDAVEVANRALTLIPTHTGITEALMRAHAANGDRLAVQRVFQAHASALEKLDLDDVAESTSELYEQLSRRSG